MLGKNTDIIQWFSIINLHLLDHCTGVTELWMLESISGDHLIQLLPQSRITYNSLLKVVFSRFQYFQR